jgi:predicted dehydrogenase
MSNAGQIVKVAIIGCGRIGTEWDSQGIAHSLAHAAAFTRASRSRLVAVCDLDRDRAMAAAERWGCGPAYSDPAELFRHLAVDLVVVATTSAARWSVIEPALAAGVKAFVIEKPLATSIQEGAEIVSALEAAGAAALVNFTRRWDPSMRRIRSRIAGGEFGDLQRLIGIYGKGLLNNGSHMIDLASMLLGARPVRVRALGTPLPASEAAWSPDRDASVDAQIVLADENGREYQLDLLGTDQSAFTCFELRIIGREIVCNITDGGRKVQERIVTDDPNFQGYRILSAVVEKDALLLESMDRMADEANLMATGEIREVSCDVQTAFQTLQAIDAIRRSINANGKWMAPLSASRGMEINDV